MWILAVVSVVARAAVHQEPVDLDVFKVDDQTENSNLALSSHLSFHALLFLFQESSKAKESS
jgi:hypothetical protein